MPLSTDHVSPLMNLNFQRQGQGPAVVLIHGLFGDLGNMGFLARALADDFDVISVDVRNHGRSPHADTMDYPALAADIHALLEQLAVPSAHVVGHSMGGKIAMQLALDAPHRVERLVVADIAPVAYPPRHDAVFAGLRAVPLASLGSRQQAEALMAEHIEMPGVRQFLLKSLARVDGQFQWRFNLEGLIAQYPAIVAAPRPGAPFTGPVLFIKGSESDYLLPEHQGDVAALFPNARARVIQGTGHWLHAEKPSLFNRLVWEFLCQ